MHALNKKSVPDLSTKKAKMAPVHIIQLSSALRSREDDTDANCEMQFTEVSNVSRWRVSHLSLPVSQFTFADDDAEFRYDTYNPGSSTFNPGSDDLTFNLGLVSSFGNTNRVFTWSSNNGTPDVTGTISNKLWNIPQGMTLHDQWAGPLAEINAIAPVGVVIIHNLNNNRLCLVIGPQAAGVTREVTFTANNTQIMAVNTILQATRTGVDDQIDIATATAAPAELSARAFGAPVLFTFAPDMSIVYTAATFAQELNDITTSFGNAFTKPQPLFSAPGTNITMVTSNFYMTIVSTTDRFLQLFPTWTVGTSFVPQEYENAADTTPPFLIAPDINFAPVPYWQEHSLLFSTTTLYTIADIVSALNTAFTPWDAVWVAANNRLKVTNGEIRVFRYYANIVLGLRENIVVPMLTEVDSPTVYDLSGGTDVLHLGCDFYQDGRSSQGFTTESKVRRRNIVGTVSNTTGVSFGTYSTVYDSSGVYYPLNGVQSISSVRVQVYDQRFRPLKTLNGIPLHFTLELA